MRVVAGDYGGRPLKALDGKTTRPTTDKVKGAIFNMIGPYFNGGRTLDLFAGSGGLSIEAVSRGMDEAVLVEKDFRAQKIVMENIKMTKEDSKFTLLKMPAEKAMNSLAAQGQKFDLVLLDPPYAKEEIENNIQFLQDKDMLSNDAIIVCETDKYVDLSNEIGNFELIKQKVYGISKISIYEKVLDQVEEENNEDMEQVND